MLLAWVFVSPSPGGSPSADRRFPVVETPRSGFVNEPRFVPSNLKSEITSEI